MQTENTYIETDLGNIALNPRGEYSDEVSYEYLDTVSYKGGSYICVAELGKSISGIAPAAEISRTAAKESEDNVKAQESKVVQSVIDEGTKQIKAVSDKATEQVKAIQKAGENALQNIGNGVDKGLSEEGKAADAKATGEAISNLTKDIVSQEHNIIVKQF